MAEVTGIAWTDSTFNPWIGCTKVGPGCDHCYAEALDKRHRWQGDTHWGPGKPRMRTSVSNWRKPLAWNKKAAASGKPWRVFCASLADVFDNEVPGLWRADLFALIEATPALTWLLLTKRIVNVPKLAPVWSGVGWPRNVWLGATVVNQEEADRDMQKLLAVRAAVQFVSYEPALGPVDFSHYGGLNWIIVGGESTQGAPARPFDVELARRTIRQCRRIGAAPFVKQLGSNVRDRNDAGFDGCEPGAWPEGTDDKVEHNPAGYLEEYQGAPVRVHLQDRAGADPAEWPEDLRVQEFPA